jgi:CheY-like chemotaxis protein
VNLRGVDVLVVEDHGDSREALGAIRAAKPDLILCDLQMPGMGICPAAKRSGQLV